MESLWFWLLLLVLISTQPRVTPTTLPGMSCVNDYINNVTCVCNSTQIPPDSDCKIIGIRKNYVNQKQINSSCDLKPMGGPDPSLRGCSFVFEAHKFSSGEKLPSIQMQCEGSEVVQLTKTDYSPLHHIKMHPPGIPIINMNETDMSWSPGSPLSGRIFKYEFQVQIKQAHQQWREVRHFTIRDQHRLPLAVEESGHYQARVRVRPSGSSLSGEWSDWSPTAAWTSQGERPTTPNSPAQEVNLTGLWLVLGAVFLFTVVIVVLWQACTNNGMCNRKHQHVPDPSKCFPTLDSVPDGDFKEWLCPYAESFFTVQPIKDISPVEVSEVWDVFPTSTSNTAVPLHDDPKTPPDSRTSSGQSSCFSNIGYFYSNYPSGLRSESCPVYFTYQEDDSSPPPTTTISSSSYERLQQLGCSQQREPLSPDSGFGVENEDQVEEEGEGKKEGDTVVSINHSPPVLILPLCLPSQRPSATHHQPPSLPQLPRHHSPKFDPAAAPSGSYTAWPIEGTLGKSSSMTVTPRCSGYLTIKELQNTYSNKSI